MSEMVNLEDPFGNPVHETRAKWDRLLSKRDGWKLKTDDTPKPAPKKKD